MGKDKLEQLSDYKQDQITNYTTKNKSIECTEKCQYNRGMYMTERVYNRYWGYERDKAKYDS